MLQGALWALNAMSLSIPLVLEVGCVAATDLFAGGDGKVQKDSTKGVPRPQATPSHGDSSGIPSSSKCVGSVPCTLVEGSVSGAGEEGWGRAKGTCTTDPVGKKKEGPLLDMGRKVRCPTQRKKEPGWRRQKLS